MLLEYSLVHATAFRPTRANPSDAGLDVYYSAKADGLHQALTLSPGQSKVIPTRLRFGVPHGYMLQVMNRSSVAAKLNLVVGACVIDSGYDGEVFINGHNIGRDTRGIQDGDKIAQLVMMPVVHFQPQENTEGTLYDYPKTISNRGTGALGSTGK